MNKRKKSNLKSPYFYMFSKKIYKKNNKVIENLTKELNNNKLTIKGFINGKRINKTNKIKTRKLFPNLIY
jgi:hypothetical protein